MVSIMARDKRTFSYTTYLAEGCQHVHVCQAFSRDTLCSRSNCLNRIVRDKMIFDFTTRYRRQKLAKYNRIYLQREIHSFYCI